MMRVENRSFVEWYAGLMKHEQAYFRGEIIRLCDVSLTTFYKWIKGDTVIKLPCKRIINSVAGRAVFDVDAAVSAFCL